MLIIRLELITSILFGIKFQKLISFVFTNLKLEFYLILMIKFLIKFYQDINDKNDLNELMFSVNR